MNINSHVKYKTEILTSTQKQGNVTVLSLWMVSSIIVIIA